jgi:hypothetical protein
MRIMADPKRWTEVELIAKATSGATKVDLMGERGATLCSQDEIIAMAAIVKHTVILPRMIRAAQNDVGLQDPLQTPSETPPERT